MNNKTLAILSLSLCALAVAACGSSGGNSEPPPPPAPVAPPPPPPEPTFEERLADLAAFDPNTCRALTPGFEALGGWLANDGRDLGTSRVWVHDTGPADGPLGVPGDEATHGAGVWRTFAACSVRADEGQYVQVAEDVGIDYDAVEEDDRDLILTRSSSPAYEDVPLPEPRSDVFVRWPYWNGEREDGGQRLMIVRSAGNDGGNRTGWLQRSSFQGLLEHHDTALWIVVGGYEGEGEQRVPAVSGTVSSNICGDADPLCLFAPWRTPAVANFVGTSYSAPQVSAALDAVWTVWPDMDILDLRNLAFDCAENMPARDGDTSTERTYSYSNGREFSSTTNSTWGHGILSLTCLFTPNGGLQSPVTGDAISGGIFGPVAGPVTGATITGIDYTGRDFGYGFARPVARENFALAATANLRPVQAISALPGLRHGRAAYQGRLWQSGALSVDLTAAGNAIGTVAQWQAGNFTVRGGVAAQPEGVGSLTGSRAFRAPSTVSAAITAAYGRALGHGFSAHLQADHWQTLATQGRSLWRNAELSESRFIAALVKRFAPREGGGHHEIALQAAWQSGLTGSLDVDGRSWPVAGVREKGVWLAWRRQTQ